MTKPLETSVVPAKNAFFLLSQSREILGRAYLDLKGLECDFDPSNPDHFAQISNHISEAMSGLTSLLYDLWEARQCLMEPEDVMIF